MPRWVRSLLVPRWIQVTPFTKQMRRTTASIARRALPSQLQRSTSWQRGSVLRRGGVERKVNGSPVDVYYKLQNKGTDDAPGFQFIIYASTDTNITKDDTEFCIRDVNAGLPAGTTTKDGVSVSCTMVTLPIGEYYLGMIVDTNGAVLETDESDNVTVDTLNKLTITN